MGTRKKRAALNAEQVVEFLNHLLEEKPLLSFVIPLILMLWAIERWFFSLYNWVPLAIAVWATIQPITPLEHCKWLNKLLMEIWPHYIGQKFSISFSEMVEKWLEHRKSRLVGSNSGSGNGWIELVIVEAKDLVAADLRGTSDPYVRVHYGTLKKRTKIIYKTLNPQWHQTLEFLDDGSPLVLHVKDHNALLPTSNIGDCVVEYQRLPPNQMSDKWIPLQGVKKGEIHVQVTRKIPETQKKPSLDSESSVSRAHQLCNKMKQMMVKFQSYINDGNVEGLSTALSELQTLEDTQEEYMVQLETEHMLLLSKIKELGQEIFNSSPSISSRSSGT